MFLGLRGLDGSACLFFEPKEPVSRRDRHRYAAGAAVVYDEPLKLNTLRSDLAFYPVPFDKLVARIFDLERLRSVASRFSSVGSEPNLHAGDPSDIVREVANYMGRRFPRGSGEVELRERYQPVPPVRHNSELLAWAIENLITNALSALDKQPSWIEVSVAPSPDGRWVEIAVTDNGRGMGVREQGRAFEPGYTTKRRGWGLGLALARRVIHDSHGGRIWIRSSVPGQGTTMAIRLPAVR